ncbi:MAG: molybdenum cofactor guanylyltransferase [Bacteroidota bacterium]|nr:molybdenum cofactor guanylyltransferase [Bacteroidota bacterium]MDX5431542.1 molybdenum cofactor guanylyltransferase [Bacteroidota bacterium]MDX5470263.1 molybdenum cofactor guanylyltransferase [Bacteroidota bacterium]
MEFQKPIGVVLCGGESSRMGIDKGLIHYHGLPQREYVGSLLSSLCSLVVWASGPESPEEEIAFPDLPHYAGNGPISGLLSIHDAFPDKDLLLVAVDYPLLAKKHLELLIQAYHREQNLAFCFESGTPPRPEPLVTLYTSILLEKIKERFLSDGENSLRRLLQFFGYFAVSSEDKQHLISADRPEDFARMREIISKFEA